MRVRLGVVLLGLRPSLRWLRGSLIFVVRQLHRYYGAARLLQNVHVRIMGLSPSRTGLLAQTLWLATTGAATLGALVMPKLMKAEAPASRVAIVRCRDYAQYGQQLSSAFDQIGGLEKLVRGKTVALKRIL